MKIFLAVIPTFLVLYMAYLYSSMSLLPRDVTTIDRIIASGYPVEQHTVQTVDGYILQLIRIPHAAQSQNLPNNTTHKPVAYLQHGMFCSSDTWILTAPPVTLAYQLVDAGYDVWLGNTRGNRYAKKHIHLSADSKDFWNFTFHEIGVYDMRAMIDYILSNTNSESLHFIGDSQGSTGFFVLLAEVPKYNRVIRTAHHLGPVVYMQNVRTPFMRFAHIASDQTFLAQWVRNREYMVHSRWWTWICNKTCTKQSWFYAICNAGLSMTGGEWHFNETLLPLLCETHPAGASTNQMLHFAQLYNVRKFQRYDFGSEANQRYYNSSTPPEYDLSNVKACVTLYYGDNDMAVEGVDVENLARRLTCAKAYKIPKQNWNHFDFFWGDQVKELINDRIIEDMQRYEKEAMLISRK